MKNKIIITAIACSICILSACSGDSYPKHGDTDSINRRYPVTVDSSKFDKDTGRNVPGMHGDSNKAKKDTTKK